MDREQTVRVAKLRLGDDGIVRILHVSGADVSLEDAQETMAAYLKIAGGKKRPLFIDTKTMSSLSRGARKFYAGEYAATVASAVALIVQTPVSRVLGNFYLGLSHPVIPSRLFDGEDEALEWLKGYLE